MKADELRKKDLTELKASLSELADQRFRLKMKQGIGQLKTNHELRNNRRAVARVKTMITEKQNAE